MAKLKDVPTGANVLDMRHSKRSRPRDNPPASSDVAIPGTPSASQPISGVPLNAVSKHQRAALMTYPVELRLSILPPDPHIHLECYKGDSDQPNDQTITQRSRGNTTDSSDDTLGENATADTRAVQMGAEDYTAFQAF